MRIINKHVLKEFKISENKIKKIAEEIINLGGEGLIDAEGSLIYSSVYTEHEPIIHIQVWLMLEEFKTSTKIKPINIIEITSYEEYQKRYDN